MPRSTRRVHAVQEPGATAQVRPAPRRRKNLKRHIRGVESRDGRQEAPRTRQRTGKEIREPETIRAPAHVVEKKVTSARLERAARHGCREVLVSHREPLLEGAGKRRAPAQV